jgi:PAS domain S-box-containing protein
MHSLKDVMNQGTPQLLVVGGTDDDARWIHRALATETGGVRLERLALEDDPRPVLAATRFDAVLVDLLSSTRDAGSWVHLLDETKHRPPLVVLADAIQEGDVAAWLSTGAADWVFRPSFLGLAAVLARLLRESNQRQRREERERRLRDATVALLELARSATSEGDDTVEILKAVSRTGVQGLDCDRCTVWLYSEDKRVLELVERSDASMPVGAHGARLGRSAHPEYFEALAQQRIVAARDTRTDRRTASLVAQGVVPPEVVSTLDVAVQSRGESMGVISFGQREVVRAWTSGEEVFAIAMADVVSLVLETIERRKIEQALAESERRFRDIFRFSSDCIVLYRVSAEGRVFCEDLNPATETSAGLKREDVIGKQASEVLIPATAARLKDRYEQAIRSRVPVVYEHELMLPSGARIFSTAMIPLPDASGRVHRLATVARDMTHHRATEALSRRLEAQMAEGQKSEALARLASHLAGDISRAFGAVDAQFEQLRSSSGVSSEALRPIVEALSHGKELSERIAALGGRVPAEQTTLDLDALVDGVIEEAALGHPLVTVARQRASQPVRVRGEAAQLRQVARNLIVYALRSMPSGGTLTIRTALTPISIEFAATHPPLRTGAWAHLSIADTGPGLDDAARRRVFEPYFSTEATGSGLGLAVVQSIVSGHQGTVLVESAVGIGTRFDVYLPPLQGGVEAPGVGRHLMLVDDHPGMARVSAKLLETLGFRTTVFDDPRQALEAFRAGPHGYDAVLTDLSMPQMSGEEFTELLRRVRPSLPIIISSGLATPLDKDALERIGVSAVLVKPWRLEEAIATLQRVLP